MSATPEGTAAMLDLIAALRENTEALKANTAGRQGSGAARGGGGAAGGGGLCFPNYGRAKLQPVKGAGRGDLEYYAAGAQRSLDDPGKARFHAKERALLDAINEELRRQAGGGMSAPPPADEFTTDDTDIPF